MNKATGFFKSTMVSGWMKSLKTGLFTTRTVDELLWGYEDSLLAKVSSTSPEVEKVFGLMYKVCTPSRANGRRFLSDMKVQHVILLDPFRKTAATMGSLCTTPDSRTTWITVVLKPGKEKGSAQFIPSLLPPQ